MNLLQNLPHASEWLKLFTLFPVAESSEKDQLHTLWGSMQHENVASFSNSFKLTIHLHALWAGGYLEGDCGYSQAHQGPVPSLECACMAHLLLDPQVLPGFRPTCWISKSREVRPTPQRALRLASGGTSYIAQGEWETPVECPKPLPSGEEWSPPSPTRVNVPDLHPLHTHEQALAGDRGPMPSSGRQGEGEEEVENLSSRGGGGWDCRWRDILGPWAMQRSNSKIKLLRTSSQWSKSH